MYNAKSNHVQFKPKKYTELLNYESWKPIKIRIYVIIVKVKITSSDEHAKDLKLDLVRG